MYTRFNIRSHSTIGWAPSFGYLLTIVGGLTIAMVGCREQDGSAGSGGVPPTIGEQDVSLANRNLHPETQPISTISPMPSLLPKAEVEVSTQGNSAPAVAAASGQVVTALKPASLTVKRLVVTPGVDNREPLSSGATLPLGQPVYAFAELASGPGAAAVVEIVFEHESGDKVGYVKLDVPSDKARWRTWGQSRNVNKTGRWTAILFNSEETELARVNFEVATPEAVTPETLQGG